MSGPAVPRASSALALTTALTLVCFAANSLLCRAALRPGLIDPALFTALRLGSGAAVLLLVAPPSRTANPLRLRPALPSAVALLAYAALFSLAYQHIDAGVGALVLFGAVQVTMIGWSLRTTERPEPRQWAGLAVALTGLALLTLPGAARPTLAGLALMAVAGIAWGAYSLRGRGVGNPVAATRDNFLAAAPLALLLLVAWPGRHLSAAGAGLALVSGALTSGLGYVLWYRVLPALGATRAAILQLLVPVLAVAGGVVLLGETLRPSTLGAGALILSGVALAVSVRSRPILPARSKA